MDDFLPIRKPSHSISAHFFSNLYSPWKILTTWLITRCSQTAAAGKALLAITNAAGPAWPSRCVHFLIYSVQTNSVWKFLCFQGS